MIARLMTELSLEAQVEGEMSDYESEGPIGSPDWLGYPVDIPSKENRYDILVKLAEEIRTNIT